MKECIHRIIVPHVQHKREELGLSVDHPALAFYDVFKGQCTEEIRDILEEHNIHAVNVLANCTDRLQPMDLSMNKSVKEFMCNKFKEWYALQVHKQLEEGMAITPIDLRLSILKPLGAHWLISLFDYLNEHKSIINNGKAAGISDLYPIY